MPDRLIFPVGEQRKFLLAVKEAMNMSWQQLSEISGAHRRSFSDWVHERYRISKPVAEKLSSLSSITIPSKHRVLSWREHLIIAGERGRTNLFKKHGGHRRVPVDEEYRQQKWREWWDTTGQYQLHPIINHPLPVNKPRYSTALAEFVGIVLGDGSISKRQITITLHRYDDKEYIQFVKKVITDLFGVVPSLMTDKKSKADNIVISRTELVNYFTDNLGLRIGNKVRQQVDIPDWIKNDGQFLKACVRGLVDTDGSVFTHKYRVNGKEYKYKKLAFTSKSQPLRVSVYCLLKAINIKPRLSGERDVRIDSQDNVAQYFKVVGTNNPKHLKRYKR